MKPVRCPRRCLLAALVVAAAFAPTLHARADITVDQCPWFQRLGFLPGGKESAATGVSADGTVVVGSSLSRNGRRAFMWTKQGLMDALGDLPFGKSDSAAQAISADGATVVGYGHSKEGQEAFFWSKAKGMVGLGYGEKTLKVPGGPPTEGGVSRAESTSPSPAPKRGLSGPPTAATAVSADGSVVVGYIRAHAGKAGDFENAFLWTPAEGLACLELDKERSDIGRALAVSADGRTVAGTSLGKAFLWTRDKGVELIGGLPGGDISAANALTPSGFVVVGETTGGDGRQAWRWTRDEGFKALGDLPGGKVDSTALAVSPDGSVVVGTSDSAAGPEAFIWDAADGMRSLDDVLRKTHRLNLGDFVLVSADALAADANTLVIVGQGRGPPDKRPRSKNPKGKPEAFMAVLPRAP